MRQWLAALLLLVAADAIAARALTLPQYIGELQSIHAALTTNQFANAQILAQQLRGATIAQPRFDADDALLLDVIHTKSRNLPLEARLASTIAELRSAISGKPAATDAKLLERLAKEQEAVKLPAGGNVPGVAISNEEWIERLADSIAKAWRWLWDKIEKIVDWILDFLPNRHADKPGATSGLRWMVGALVALIVIVIAVLAFEVIRRSRAAKPEVIETSEPLGSTRDEDPLSRGVNEWERYAAQLAAAGRIREAIRAWYHAVLVTLYAAGILHFRKGRTNWEYIAALAPSLPWRAEFIALTRRFEREWYGADESSHDALDECSDAARRIIESVRRTSRGAA
ncbi:MAG TPA: DUF4129 domain-containing protein [Thermoanaerobaculia bacterium]|nr:DUF4129 domain-containing protein [Thermoanaerobaculia bacterium]